MDSKTEPVPIDKAELFSRLPPPWPDGSLRAGIAAERARSGRCLVALDDDPTGTQTVHDVWVLARWGVDDLRLALADGEPALYVLTNTRSLPLAQAQALNREVAANLAAAARLAGRPVAVVSRSDSTLRGHFPGETDALAEALIQADGAPFDATLLIPFFPEGGRFTVGGVHYVQDGARLVPAAQTPYARDPSFGYVHSRLPEWVEEKTGGRVRAGEVVLFPLELLRAGGPEWVAGRLLELRGGRIAVVDAAADRDLEVFAAGLLRAEAAGRRFLFRTAASFVKIAAGIPDRPLLTGEELAAGRPPGGGLVVFGSYVPKSSAQLEAVRALPGLDPVELDVPRVLDPAARPAVVAEAAAAVNAALAAGRDALLFTSRALVSGQGQGAHLSVGQSVSAALMQVVGRVAREPRFVIGKGGITSSDLATQGLGVRAARVLGQARPGVPVWRLGAGSRWPGLPYIVFPGNVGETETVAELVLALRPQAGN